MVASARAGAAPIGRAAEMQLVVELLGDGSPVVLCGGAGVGKTHLARAACASFADQGIEVTWAVGSRAAQPIPLGALAHLVPASAPLGETSDSLLPALVATLRETAGRDRLVAIDDAHLLDPASATLVRLLVGGPGPRLLLTVRSDEAVPDALAGLLSGVDAGRVDLQGLSEPDTASLVAEILGGPVDRADVRRIWQLTRGNPLFVLELLVAMRRQGVLRRRAGWWTWTETTPPVGTAATFLADRLTRLDRAGRLALQAVAQCEPVELDLVTSELEDPQVLADLEEEGLLQVVVTGGRECVQTTHPLLGEAVRASTPRTRAREVRRRVAEALLTRDDLSEPDLVRAVLWSLEGGATVAGARLTAAARHAWLAGDAQLARRFAEPALTTPSKDEARYILAQALADLGRFADAIEEFGTLRQSGDGRLAALGARGQAEIIGYVQGRRADALEVLDEAIDSIDPRHTDVLVATRAVLASHEGAVEDATRAADGVLADDASPDAALLALLATLPQALVAGRLGEVRDALPRVRACVDALATSSPNAALWAGLVEFTLAFYEGDLAAANAVARREHDASLSAAHPVGRGYWTEALALVELRRGRPATAVRLAEEAVAVYAGYDNGARRGGLLLLALARAQSGDPTGADDALEEADRERRGAPVSLLDPASARTWVLAGRGLVGEAVDCSVAAAEAARRRGAGVHELQLLHDAARLGAALRVRDRVAALASQVEGAWARAVSAQIEGLATGDVTALDGAADALARLGSHLDAAETWFACARYARRDGLRAAEARASHAAQDALTRLDGARTPGLARAGTAGPLTPREQEVALLVAHGSADKEVARGLGISVRTVNAHLRSIYAKLAVEGRGELAEALAPGAPVDP